MYVCQIYSMGVLFEKYRRSFSKQNAISLFSLVALLLVSLIYNVSLAHAFTSASLALSDSRPGQASTTYTVTYTPTSTTAIKTITYVFCTTASGGCSTPSMTTTGGSQGTYTGLSGSSPTSVFTTNGTITTTVGTPAAQALSPISIAFSGITNPTPAGTYFMQITTKDAGAATIETSTVAFATTTGISASVSVDPTLTFAVNALTSGTTVNGLATNVTTTSSTIPFGTVTTATNGIAGHSLVVTTNAASGYTVYIKYTGQLTSGTNTIADHLGNNAAPTNFPSAGTLAAFGYTTESTSLSGSGNRFNVGATNKYSGFTTSNLEVARSAVAVSSDTTKIGYQVGITGTTPAGTYTTTVVLTATPTY